MNKPVAVAVIVILVVAAAGSGYWMGHSKIASLPGAAGPAVPTAAISWAPPWPTGAVTTKPIPGWSAARCNSASA